MNCIVKTVTVLFLLGMLCGGKAFCASDPDADKISGQYERRLDALKKKYDAALKKMNDETIKKYEVLLKRKTKDGKLKDALEIQSRIDALRDSCEYLSSDGNGDDSSSGGSLSDSQSRAEISKNYAEFYKALIVNDIKKARSYVDPEMVRGATPKIIDSYLGVMSAHLQAAKLSSDDVKTSRIKIGRNGKEAKVSGKYRFGMKWVPQDKPSYWVQRKGQWYLGDEKELKNFK